MWPPGRLLSFNQETQDSGGALPELAISDERLQVAHVGGHCIEVMDALGSGGTELFTLQISTLIFLVDLLRCLPYPFNNSDALSIAAT